MVLLTETAARSEPMVLLAETAARSEPLLGEFGVLLCEDVALQVRVLGLFSKSRFIGCNLLRRERHDSRPCPAEFVMRGDFRRFVGFLGEVTRIADSTCVKRFLFLGEISVAVLTDFAPIVIHHVNGLVTCHSWLGLSLT